MTAHDTHHQHMTFSACAAAIAEAGLDFAARGWTPATSSNFSMRMDDTQIAITRSGRDKGRLGEQDIMRVDLQGQALTEGAMPSAETALHTQIYRRFPNIDVVLHTHSQTQSVASRLFAAEGVLQISGWELQKAITGHDSHESTLELPVFPNTQHMPDLTSKVDAWLDSGKALFGYLIDGHGLYTWGPDMRTARRHLEALEFLLTCELDLRRLNAAARKSAT